MLEVQRKGAWRKKREKKEKREGEGEDKGSQTSLCLFLSFLTTPHTHTHTHTRMHAVSFRLSVSYINLPVNPPDLNDPSTAAAAPRDGRRDKDVRWRRERGEWMSDAGQKEGHQRFWSRVRATTKQWTGWGNIGVTSEAPPGSHGVSSLFAFPPTTSLPPLLSTLRELSLGKRMLNEAATPRCKSSVTLLFSLFLSFSFFFF